MPLRRIVAPQATQTDPKDSGPLEQAFAALRTELGLSTDYPQDAAVEAKAAAQSPQLPKRDETSVPFWTVDPPGSTDLDQAMYLEKDGQGFRVRYAIADLSAFVQPGGALDTETRRRTQTIYFPDLRVPLHPQVLSEDAASLLPEQTRPAYVWDLRLDAQGQLVQTSVDRALVRSTARHDYDELQAAVDGGDPPEQFALLKQIGELRIAAEQARGGASLPMPEQEVRLVEGRYEVTFRPPVAAEDWNAQISLLTGMAAAELMLQAKIGILRTMPQADPEEVAKFRRTATALGVDWPQQQAYGEFLRTLDRQNPVHLALIHAATSLFRGAGYTPFNGELPAEREQAAVAAPYAHVTAPLRRLVDRFGLAICAAVSAGEPVPEWATQALPELPELMSGGGRIAGEAERGSADAVEAALLSGLIGTRHPAVAVAQRKETTVVQLTDLPVLDDVPGQVELGAQLEVEVVSADIPKRSVELKAI
ncbi:RNB domain-containing ribonuclease [Dermacoccaceae bacterium W4C1]